MPFYARVRAPSLGAVLTYVCINTTLWEWLHLTKPFFYTVELLILIHTLLVITSKPFLLLRYNTKPVSWNLVSGQTSALHPQEEDQEL